MNKLDEAVKGHQCQHQSFHLLISYFKGFIYHSVRYQASFTRFWSFKYHLLLQTLITNQVVPYKVMSIETIIPRRFTKGWHSFTDIFTGCTLSEDPNILRMGRNLENKNPWSLLSNSELYHGTVRKIEPGRKHYRGKLQLNYPAHIEVDSATIPKEWKRNDRAQLMVVLKITHKMLLEDPFLERAGC